VIIVFGSGDDSCIERVVDAALELGVEHRLIDQRRLDHDDLLLEVGPSAVRCLARVADEVIDLGDAEAVYARPLGVGTTARSHAFGAAFTEWLDLADALVVNRPISMRSNSSKPYQCQLIAEAGFAVPDTLVSNDPNEVREFAERHGRVIFKSTSGIRSIVRELDEQRLDALDGVRSLPTQFQAYVPGVDTRVHVVGGATFATEMATDAIDYRYSRLDGKEVSHLPVELDGEVAQRCVALAELLELPLCGIDLRRRADGGYVCFEVNPMPAFSYYEAHTGQPIAHTLVEFLSGKV
jgi:glutathione synthase/RimK-type ligase-like ATP-grasp enzyme